MLEELLNKEEAIDLAELEAETVATIWLEGDAVVCREKAQTGIVYRNVKV